MQQFLYNILKHKKVVLFICIFFVALGVTIPLTARAGLAGCSIGLGLAIVSGVFGTIFSFGLLTPVVITAVAVAGSACAVGSMAQNGLDAAGQNFWKAIIEAVGDIIYSLTHDIASYSVGWLSQIINTKILTKPILSQGAFVIGWSQVRDLSDMFIVLGFVIIGIATALRIKEYEAKKLLLPLILVALLVNFSGLLCGVVIDGSHILIIHFLKAGGSSGPNILGSFDLSSRGVPWQEMRVNGEMSRYLEYVATYSVSFVLIAIVYFYLTFILLASQAIFGILFVLSPLAFFCWVFPATKKVWSMWWENFIKWGLIGAQISFFLWIAGTMMTAAKQMSTVELIGILVLLFVSVRVAKTSSAVGAGAVIGFTTGAMMGGAGFAFGAAKSAVGSTMQKAAKSETGQKIGSGVDRALVGLGLRKPGVNALSRANDIKEAESRMSALIAQGDLARVKRIARGEGMRTTPKERAGATGALLKTGDIDMSNAKEVAGLSNFQSQGGNLKEYSAKDPRLARHDISATRNTMTKNPGISEDQAKQKNTDSSYSGLGVRGMRDLKADAMDLNFMSNASYGKNAKASDEYSRDQILKQKSYTIRGSSERAEAMALSGKLKAEGTPEALDKRERLLRNLVAAKRMKV